MERIQKIQEITGHAGVGTSGQTVIGPSFVCAFSPPLSLEKREAVGGRLSGYLLLSLLSLDGKLLSDVSAVDLEADFDPETHDKAMESMLGEDYDDHEETADPKQLRERHSRLLQPVCCAHRAGPAPWHAQDCKENSKAIMHRTNARCLDRLSVQWRGSSGSLRPSRYAFSIPCAP